MIKRFYFLFLILLVEGASLMAVELMGAKLLAPFYGSSLYVWTAILCITVLGLSLGYYIGGRLSEKYASEKLLIFIVSIASLLVYALPITAVSVISITANMQLIQGICMASFLLLIPPMFCFGLVGPMVVRLMASRMENIGHVAGSVYFTSTLGGILATFLFGFYLIPEAGLKFSAHLTAIALVFLLLVYFFKTIFSNNYEVVLDAEEDAKNEIKPQTVSKAKISKVQGIKIKNTVYLFAALEGATVMAVELMAARMLAPYFGSGLFVWVAVIGITLLSLAIGYFVGGRLADKYTSITTLHWVLLFSAIFLLCMHFVSQQLTMVFIGMEIRMAAVLVSIFLLLPPLLFLGMVPTMLVRLLTRQLDAAGSTCGRVFTLSSFSGILALPIMGFFIIPEFGITTPSIVIGLLVGILPFAKLLAQKKYFAFLFFSAYNFFVFAKKSSCFLQRFKSAELLRRLAGASLGSRCV